eukprot:Rmarinus@m.21060
MKLAEGASDVFVKEGQRDFKVQNARGDVLFGRCWIPKRVTGLVFFVHGLGDYLADAEECPIPGHFDDRANSLLPHDFACFGVEHIGHGRSAGLPGYIEDFQHLVDDALALMELVSSHYGGNCGHSSGNGVAEDCVPKFVWGESLGGAVTTFMGHRRPDLVHGFVLQAPMLAIDPSLVPPQPVVSLLRAVNWMVPWLAAVPGDSSALTEKCYKDPKHRELAYQDSRRYHGRQRLNTALQCMEACGQIAEIQREIEVPFLVVHGADDSVTTPESSRQFYEEAASEVKTYKLYEGAMHSLLSDADVKDSVYEDIVAFFKTRRESIRQTRPM